LLVVAYTKSTHMKRESTCFSEPLSNRLTNPLKFFSFKSSAVTEGNCVNLSQV